MIYEYLNGQDSLKAGKKFSYLHSINKLFFLFSHQFQKVLININKFNIKTSTVVRALRVSSKSQN